MSAHHMTSHCITWHDITQAITSHQMTWPPHQMTWHASKQVTSPPWNSRRLVPSKEMVWASRWSVALRTFYRQILSLLYSSFFFWNFRPRLARELLVYAERCWTNILKIPREHFFLNLAVTLADALKNFIQRDQIWSNVNSTFQCKTCIFASISEHIVHNHMF